MDVQFVKLVLLLMFKDVCIMDRHPIILVVNEGRMFYFKIKEIFVIIDTLIALQVIIIFKLVIG